MKTTNSRKQFLYNTTAVAAAFQAFPYLNAEVKKPIETKGLVPDKKQLIDLPVGFTYKIISKKGQKMSDGFLVPDAADGMGAFAGPDGQTILVRNHELGSGRNGAFGEKNILLEKIDKNLVYDHCGGKVACGGTTTLVLDKQGNLIGEYLSLAGTIRNCAGGVTPWGTWISCEETVAMPNKKRNGGAEKEHGYCFEVDPKAKNCKKPVPLKAMGRFNHEAIAIDPNTGIVYLTEDTNDGLFYRFIPKKKNNLSEGGQLQALKIKGDIVDTRNWKETKVNKNEPMSIEWVDLDNVESPKNDLRKRGFNKGAALFARGEGIWYGENGIYFCCTSGGRVGQGQIFRLQPGKAKEDKLTLFVESENVDMMSQCDNLTVGPGGSLYVCEDRKGPVIRLLKVDSKGKVSVFANAHTNSELAGVCFAPDGKTMFVNIQKDGLTLAIKGPFA
jgi:uncharacterized protein